MIHRIIARLDIKGPNLVKGIHLEGLRVLGAPNEFAKYYYENGADELIYVDMVASLYGRNSLDHIIKKTAEDIFIPLTVSGGIRSINDIKRVLRCGADKVAINTSAIKRPEFIARAANIFGSSTIAVSIETIKQTNGQYLAFTDNGREYTGIDVLDWAKKADSLGAGEIILTSVDKEGTGEGCDINLLKKVTMAVDVPVVASGGVGTEKHVEEAILQGGADAVAIASVLHYQFIKNIRKLDSYEEGNTEFLKSNINFSKIHGSTIKQIKKYLKKRKITVRH